MTKGAVSLVGRSTSALTRAEQGHDVIRSGSTMSEISSSPDGSAVDELGPGARVEVRSRFDEQWSAGFEVVEVADSGFRIRRLSDGAELPSVFSPDEVRQERRRKRSMWWY